MRVIAGTYRSRFLKSLKGLFLRPTCDRPQLRWLPAEHKWMYNAVRRNPCLPPPPV
jgi:hypothetical protein